MTIKDVSVIWLLLPLLLLLLLLLLLYYYYYYSLNYLALEYCQLTQACRPGGTLTKAAK